MKQVLLIGMLLSLSTSFAGDVLDRINVMTYNVENLFDTKHDAGKNDIQYLPQSFKKKNPELLKQCDSAPKEHWRIQCREYDWNHETLNTKMKNLAKVVTASNNGKCPDLLILQEVENKEVLEEWRTKYLKKCHYHQTILLEGDDERGIDVGFMTRLGINKKSVRIHYTDWNTEESKHAYDTRGIYQVDLMANGGNKLVVFGIHMPAQHLPQSMRIKQISHLNKLQSELPSGTLSLAAGDFNISKKEETLYNLFESDWSVSHHIGCEECKGTYNYGGTWQFLDAILVNKALREYIDVDSIKVIQSVSDQLRPDGSKPNRFDVKTKKGYSDHLPLSVDINIPTKDPKSLMRRKLLGNKKWSGKVKVAFFDADSTLRVSKSGNVSANGPKDVYLLPFVAEKLAELNQQGFLVAIVSNQGGVGRFISLKEADSALFYTTELIKRSGGRVDYIDFADNRDINRKGGVGMGLRLDSLLNKNFNAKIDWKNSFMVGDSSYKKGDILPMDRRQFYAFSHSDRYFAENLGIPFHEPCDFFGWYEAFGINIFNKLEQVIAVGY